MLTPGVGPYYLSSGHPLVCNSHEYIGGTRLPRLVTPTFGKGQICLQRTPHKKFQPLYQKRNPVAATEPPGVRRGAILRPTAAPARVRDDFLLNAEGGT